MSYVQMPVPEERVADVYRLLASQSVVADESGSSEKPWEDSGAVKEHLGPRSDTIRGLAKYLANRPDQDVTADEAASALGLPYGWNSLAGALGAFGNYCTNHDLSFPWETKEGLVDGRIRMRLTAKTAAAIKQAAL